MDAVLEQLAHSGGEWSHFALGLTLLAIGGFSTVFWFFYRRDVRRNDEVVAETKARLDDHDSKISSHDRQIRDTRTSDAQIRGKLDMGAFPYTE